MTIRYKFYKNPIVTKFDGWAIRLNEELKRQYSLSLNNFTGFNIELYSSLSEARQVLKNMFYNNQYLSEPLVQTHTFINIDSGERVEIAENQIHSHSKAKLEMSDKSIRALINDSDRVIKNWKYSV